MPPPATPTDRLPFLCQHLLNTPLAIDPRGADSFLATMADSAGFASLLHGHAAGGASAVRAVSAPVNEQDAHGPRGGRIAVIQVQGNLVARLGCLSPLGNLTGYDGIRLRFLDAIADPQVAAIVLDIDSPGGVTSGCLDLADTIARHRGSKPVWAILSESALSSAYALASAADRITVPRTGSTGGVGVLAMHCDISRALGMARLSVTLVTYGKRKAEGSAVQPLSRKAHAQLQADVDTIGEMFVATVARNRRLGARAVRSAEGASFLGADGTRNGFADAIRAPADAFAELRATLKPATRPPAARRPPPVRRAMQGE